MLANIANLTGARMTVARNVVRELVGEIRLERNNYGSLDARFSGSCAGLIFILPKKPGRIVSPSVRSLVAADGFEPPTKGL